MARGQIGRWGRSSVVVRGRGSGGYPGYYLAGQKFQRAKDGGTYYNVYKQFPTTRYGGGGGGTIQSTSAPASTGGGSTPPSTTPGTPPGNEDNNNGLDRLGRSGLEIPKTRESRARRRASTRGRRAQGTRRSLRIGKSLAGQPTRSGVNTGD